MSKRYLFLFLALITCALFAAGCAGDDGSDGAPGAAGAQGEQGEQGTSAGTGDFLEDQDFINAIAKITNAKALGTAVSDAQKTIIGVAGEIDAVIDEVDDNANLQAALDGIYFSSVTDVKDSMDSTASGAKSVKPALVARFQVLSDSVLANLRAIVNAVGLDNTKFSAFTDMIASIKKVGYENVDSAKDDRDPGDELKTPNGDVLVIAHRGASGYLPEHTLEAYELAVEMGADYIEPNLQLTSDGELVAMHDDSLRRTTNVEEVFGDDHRGNEDEPGSQYLVSNYTLAEIKTLTVTYNDTKTVDGNQTEVPHPTSYPGFTPTHDTEFKVPTFQEVITLAKELGAVKGKIIGIYPEAKQADPDMEDKILADLMANDLTAADDYVFIQSFSRATLESIKAKQADLGMSIPLLALGYMVDVDGEALLIQPDNMTSPISYEDCADYADGMGLSLSAGSYGETTMLGITKDIIDNAHAAGLLVHGWTFSKANIVEAAKEYSEYLEMGIDGMFSNYSDIAVKARNTYLENNPKLKKPNENVLVIAHRGASGYLPEHTLEAYELAVEMGADYIEPDLQLTSDGELVAMHDGTLTRTTDVQELFPLPDGEDASAYYRVSNFTLDQIKTLTVQAVNTESYSYPGFTPTYNSGFKVPTFQEVITLAEDLGKKKGRFIGLYPEAKQADPDMEDKILADLLANDLKTADSYVFIQSFSRGTLESIKEKQASMGMSIPLLALGYMVDVDGEALLIQTDDMTNPISYEDCAGYADGMGLSLSTGSYGGTTMLGITKDIIDNAHAAGLLVHGWTFSETDVVAAAEEYDKYLEMGIDGMFSNYSDLAVMARDAYLANR